MANFDLAVIGGGPAGYVAAERAGARGLRVVLFEKRQLGGVCLNEGCIPTKTLLYSAKTLDNALQAGKYGVTVEGVGFDYAKIVARKNKVVRKLVAGVGAAMKAHQVTVVKEVATITGRAAEGIVIEAAGETYIATNLLICTGSEAFIPPIPGLAEGLGERVLTNREILDLAQPPASLVIIGGGVIGVEFASFFNSLGTQVTVVEMLPEILGQSDREIAGMLRAIYTKKGVTFNLSSRVTRVEGGDVYFTDSEGAEQVVSAEKILVSVGRKPVTQDFGLETLGVETERGAIKVDDHLRTNVPGVYAAGDVTGRSMLAHTASREAEVVVNNLTGDADVMRYDAVPAVVYTNPEVASVGLTADTAREKGLEVRELKLPMAYSGRFVAENEGGEGLCKVVVEAESQNAENQGADNRKVLGIHLLGNPASEIIWGAGLVIKRGLTLSQMQKVIFPHPTVSEILKELRMKNCGAKLRFALKNARLCLAH
jgi:dihydrolipoamide dehydrogenase